MTTTVDLAWETCSEASCIGVRLPTDTRCLAHADGSAIEAALRQLSEDGRLDIRGVELTPQLLDRLLAAAPHSDSGHALLTDVYGERAVFLGPASFREISFRGNALFEGATFSSTSRFDRATFASSSSFRGATFSGDVSFVECTFQGIFDAREARFEGVANFDRATFQGQAAFGAARFIGDASLVQALFQGDGYFNRTRFEGQARLNETTFHGDAVFIGARFVFDAAFIRAVFQGPVGFEGVRFNGNTTFGEASFQHGDPLLNQATFGFSPDVTGALVAGEPMVLSLVRVGTRRGAANDRAVGEDYLNFKDYVEAFVELIRSPDTTPPLTIGIFGSWGTGKSFLLGQIEHELRTVQREPRAGDASQDQKQLRKIARHRREEYRSQLRQRAAEARAAKDGLEVVPPFYWVHTVNFNAWEYSASEVIWPGLVRKVMDRLEQEISWGFPGRFFHRFWRNFTRQIKQTHTQVLAAVVVILALLVFGLWYFEIDLAVVGAAALALVASLVTIVADGLWPLSRGITTLFQKGKYGTQIGYMADIRSDLEFLEQRLSKDYGRILILIDDLDRCEPDKAVEVLQAINLLLNFNSFIVCLGIDARVVTRAVEMHYKDVLSSAGASGYEYLDKVVQIPFRILEPTDEEVENFLAKQMGSPKPPLVVAAPDQEQSEDRESANEENTAAPRDAGNLEEVSRISEPVEFTYLELQAFRGLVPVLRKNPRHLKRLVNVYRLVRTLADLKGEVFVRDNPAITTSWLIMCAQWPLSTFAMLSYYNELRRDSKKYDEARNEAENAGVTALEYLYQKTTTNRLADKERQRALDDDPRLLEHLLGKPECPGWEQLGVLVRFTVNFNPAVEVEFGDVEESSGESSSAGEDVGEERADYRERNSSDGAPAVAEARVPASGRPVSERGWGEFG
jgi:uncharacterized protein YjbI with pentapeptide repeats/Cdc6-like AAA superfamily ATPase